MRSVGEGKPSADLARIPPLRQAIFISPFFFYTNYDSVIECFPACQSADNPAKYPPVTTGKNLLDKFLMMTAIGASGERASRQP